MLYFTTGHPGPDLHGGVRAGDNLFSVSIVALDAMKPGTMGGANWPPSSYNPETSQLYVCASDRISTFRVQDPLNKHSDNVVFLGAILCRVLPALPNNNC